MITHIRIYYHSLRSKIAKLKLKKLDAYIVRKFLGTFVYSILLMIVIAVIFDTSEKIDDFIETNAPIRAIIFDYYLNFIPYFTILYSNLFTFIAVIFFTSKMAYNTEIVAILGSGVSYKRMLMPYLLSSTIIAVLAFLLMNFVVPNANKVRLEFEEHFIHNRPVHFTSRNIHKQVLPGVVVYMETYNNNSNSGYKFSIEKFEKGQLVSKLMAEYFSWDSVKHKWNLREYYIRTISGQKESIKSGTSIDTSLNMFPSEFRRRSNIVESMDYTELNNFIKEQKLQGAENIDTYYLEKYKRVSLPFSTYILALIGVTVSSRKVRGGTGLHIGIGLGLAFSYLIFMQFSSQFAISGVLNPLFAVWLPNIIYALIGYLLYKATPK